jgi:hypothetical protein
LLREPQRVEGAPSSVNAIIAHDWRPRCADIGACLMARKSRRFNPDADHRPALRDFDPSELRGVLGHAFLTALVIDFKAKGRRLIPQLRKERRQDYLKLVFALLPKTFRIFDIDLPRITEEEEAEFRRVLEQARDQLAQKRRQAQAQSATNP